MGSADVLNIAGKLADFLIIDPTRFGPVSDPYASLVFVTSEPDLDCVYVGGTLRVDHGHLNNQNISMVDTEVNQRVARIRAKQ